MTKSDELLFYQLFSKYINLFSLEKRRQTKYIIITTKSIYTQAINQIAYSTHNSRRFYLTILSILIKKSIPKYFCKWKVKIESPKPEFIPVMKFYS